MPKNTPIRPRSPLGAGAVRDRLPRLRRPRTAVLLVMALLLAWLIWLTSPLFHWLWFGTLYRHPVGALLIVAAAYLFFRYLARRRRMDGRAWALLTSLVTVIVGYALLASALAQSVLVRDLNPVSLGQLPETGQVRYLPMPVAEKYGQNRVQDPRYHLGNFEPLDLGDELDWVSPRVPSGEWNRFTGQGDGFAVVKNDGSVETIAQPMVYGEEMHLAKAITWQLLRRRYFVEYSEIYYVGYQGRVLGVAPYLGYRFQFPVLVPYWAGVALFHADGQIEYLAPSQAQADPRLAGQRLYPEQLALAVSRAWAYRHGIANAWFRHVDQVEIPRVADAANQMPYLLPSQSGPQWFVAAEPYGPAFGIFKMFWFDAHSGQLSLHELPVSSSLIGPNRAGGYVRSAFPSYSWFVRAEKQSSGNVLAIEPRPLVQGGRLYWMVTVTTVESAGITHTVLVDASDSSVRYFDSLAELKEFQGGRFAGRMPSGQARSAPGELPSGAAGAASASPVAGGSELGRLSDRELVDLLQQISAELARRQR